MVLLCTRATVQIRIPPAGILSTGGRKGKERKTNVQEVAWRTSEDGQRTESRGGAYVMIFSEASAYRCLRNELSLSTAAK